MACHLIAGEWVEGAFGHALDPATDIGPAVDADQLQQDLDYIEVGREEGARLEFGGRQLERETPGYYIEPALFTDSTNDMRINREEMFGPIAGVIRAHDYDEAVAVANDTPYGLAASICTTSARLAADFRRRAATGLVCPRPVWITTYRSAAPRRRAMVPENRERSLASSLPTGKRATHTTPERWVSDSRSEEYFAGCG